MARFGIPEYTVKFNMGLVYSTFGYVLESDGTLHICTEAGELIH